MDFIIAYFDYILIIILVILSAFFSSSETALTALSRAKIHKLKLRGVRQAKYVEKLRQRKDHLISSILIGNNLVNIAASAITTKLLIEIFGSHAVIYTTLIMTFIIVIFAEVLPKTYAIYNSEKLALKFALILTLFVKIISPITILVNKLVAGFSWLFRINIKANNSGVSSMEELKGTIDLFHKEGYVARQDKDMLESVIELSETDVSLIMTHRKNILMINASDNIKKICEVVLKSPYTRIPVWETNRDNIIGILHSKDLLKHTLYSTKSIDDLDIKKIISKPWFVPETSSVRDQLLAFKQKRNHFAMVVDEYGSLQGIVTLEDVLEEIVGDIHDEHDKGSNKFYKKINNNSFLIKGSATIRDLNRELELNLPEGESSTIAGLLITQAEKIPDRGEVFEFFNIRFKVEEKYKQQIKKIKIVKLEIEE